MLESELQAPDALRNAGMDDESVNDMDKKRLEGFRQRLLELREELIGRQPAKIEPNRTDGAKAGANEDEQPLNEMLQAIASNRNRVTATTLARIDSALARLRDEPEDFGYCQECGEDIPPRRLDAMPYAEFCIPCQSKQDDHRGGPTRRKLTEYR